jgi:SAM-dependent methyltransferase
VPTVPQDYDDDPGRRGAWVAPRDVFEIVAPELVGPVLDAGCGEGRLAAQLSTEIRWVGLDLSPAQLALCEHRPVVRGDLRQLPFGDATFAEVTHLWCLYHLDRPVDAIREASRVLRPGGRYYTCTAARDSDPELLPEGYPPSTFDAEEAADIVAEVFDDVQVERWDGPFFPLSTREEVRAYCRHSYIPPERADDIALPLWLTKRGALVRATKRPAD